RHRHLRQGRPGRAGRRRAADLAHGRADRRRHRGMRLGRRAALPPLALALLIAALLPARACDLDNAGTTQWRVTREHGASFLVTPCGEKFFSIGVNVLDAGISGARLDRPHYDWHDAAASLPQWIGDTRARLKDWGFNSAGAWSLPPQQ